MVESDPTGVFVPPWANTLLSYPVVISMAGYSRKAPMVMPSSSPEGPPPLLVPRPTTPLVAPANTSLAPGMIWVDGF